MRETLLTSARFRFGNRAIQTNFPRGGVTGEHPCGKRTTDMMRLQALRGLTYKVGFQDSARSAYSRAGAWDVGANIRAYQPGEPGTDPTERHS